MEVLLFIGRRYLCYSWQWFSGWWLTKFCQSIAWWEEKQNILGNTAIAAKISEAFTTIWVLAELSGEQGRQICLMHFCVGDGLSLVHLPVCRCIQNSVKHLRCNCFLIMVGGFQLWIIFAKSSISDAWLASEYVFPISSVPRLTI